MTVSLTQLGYTERESTFLPLAALLSGYFVRRQFNGFIERECGALGQRFIQRGLSLGHLEQLPEFAGRAIYHVSSSSIYAALGEPGNRNRREHGLETICTRLMALDFALLRPRANWVLAEKAKKELFCGMGVQENDLPYQAFAKEAKRFFVGKQPICLGDSGCPEFAFIDCGAKTLSQWELFLKSHRALLQRLSGAELVFASCDCSRFDPAENLFRKTIAGEARKGEIDSARLVRFFQARKHFEEKRFDLFDQPGLDQLREDKLVFAGVSFDELYLRWCRDGGIDLLGTRPAQVVFRTQVLPHSYEWLSPFSFQERRA